MWISLSFELFVFTFSDYFGIRDVSNVSAVWFFQVLTMGTYKIIDKLDKPLGINEIYCKKKKQTKQTKFILKKY